MLQLYARSTLSICWPILSIGSRKFTLSNGSGSNRAYLYFWSGTVLTALGFKPVNVNIVYPIAATVIRFRKNQAVSCANARRFELVFNSENLKVTMQPSVLYFSAWVLFVQAHVVFHLNSHWRADSFFNCICRCTDSCLVELITFITKARSRFWVGSRIIPRLILMSYCFRANVLGKSSQSWSRGD